VIHPWPSHTPDLTGADFLWSYVKEKVCVSQLLKNLEEHKIRIKDAFNAVTPDMISNLSSMALA